MVKGTVETIAIEADEDEEVMSRVKLSRVPVALDDLCGLPAVDFHTLPDGFDFVDDSLSECCHEVKFKVNGI
jgi:hypothetical protein